MPLNPQRAISDLEQLRALTSNEHGAQRIAWTPTWLKARSWFQEKLAEFPAEHHLDAAGNSWTTLHGQSDTIPGEPYTLWVHVPAGFQSSRISAEANTHSLPVTHELNGQSLKLQFRGQPQGAIDAGGDAGGEDIAAVDHHALVDRNGTEEWQ